MRKINPKDFVLFRLERPGFSYSGRSWKDILRAFQSWASPCRLMGIRENGSEAIIDEK